MKQLTTVEQLYFLEACGLGPYNVMNDCIAHYLYGTDTMCVIICICCVYVDVLLLCCDRNVKVIRLVGLSTVEEIILRRAEHKLRLTHNVMSSTTANTADDADDDADHHLKVTNVYHDVTEADS